MGVEKEPSERQGGDGVSVMSLMVEVLVPRAEVTYMGSLSHAEVQHQLSLLVVPASLFGGHSVLCAFSCKQAALPLHLPSELPSLSCLGQLLGALVLPSNRVSQLDGDTQPPWSSRAIADGSRERQGDILHPRRAQGILPDCAEACVLIPCP